MAVLTAQQRAEVRSDFMQALSAIHEQCTGLTKADLLAAVNGLDDYLNTNAAAINSAIPQPARANLSTAQKARLLNLVVTKRYITGA